MEDDEEDTEENNGVTLDALQTQMEAMQTRLNELSEQVTGVVDRVESIATQTLDIVVPEPNPTTDPTPAPVVDPVVDPKDDSEFDSSNVERKPPKATAKRKGWGAW